MTWRLEVFMHSVLTCNVLILIHLTSSGPQTRYHPPGILVPRNNTISMVFESLARHVGCGRDLRLSASAIP